MKAAPIHRAFVNSKGVLVFEEPARWHGALSRLRGKSVHVVVSAESSRRSPSQNSWYWAVIVPYVATFLSEATGLPLDKDDAHDLLKRVFLGVEKTPLGEIAKSSAALSVEEFSSYCTQIQAYAASEWGLVIPGPNEFDAGRQEAT